MRKGTKIALIVVGSIVGFLVIAWISVDIWVSRVAHNAIQKSLAKMDSTELVVRTGNIHVELLTGMIDITDIYIATDTNTFDTSEPRKTPGMEIAVPHLTLELINYYELIRYRHIQLFGITLHHPRAVVWLDEKHPDACLPKIPKDTNMVKMHTKLTGIDLGRVRLNRLSAELKSVRTHLYTKVDSLSAEVKDLQYNFADSLFSYNDSLYSLSSDRIYMRLPDGSKDLTVCDLNTEDSGPFKLGETRLRDLLNVKRMAEKAKEPVSWIDLTLARLETSPINPIHKVMNKDWTLDSLFVDVKRLQLIRDTQYEPKKPFQTPQQFLLKLPVKFEVMRVGAHVSEIDIKMTTTGDTYGQLQLKDIKASMQHVTNRRNAVWTNHVRAPFGQQGKVNAMFAMYMNPESTFDCEIFGKDLELGLLNPLIRPLTGLTFESHVDKLESTYCGNRTVANGDFLMMYHGLKVAYHPEEQVSIKALKQYGKTIENLANSLIPKSNPTAVDIAPRRYKVSWERDEWKPYPLYIFGPCINGVVETMLPGLYVHKQIR